MKWIRVASRVAQDAKVRELARIAGCDTYKAVGHLVTLWGTMTDEAKDGNLSTVHASDIEAWADWRGRRGVFAKAVRATLCDDRGIISAWEKYQGAAIRENEADKRRKSPGKAPESPPELRDNSAGTPPELRGHSSGPSRVRANDARVNEDENENENETNTKVQTAAAAAAAAREELAAVLPADYGPDLDELLARAEPAARTAWLRKLLAKTSGLHPPTVPPPILGEALREFNAAGGEANWRRFEGFLRKLTEPTPPRPATSPGTNGAYPVRQSASEITHRNALAAVDALTAIQGAER